MVSGGSTPIGSRPVSTFGNPLVFKPSAAALRKAIEKVEVSKVSKAIEEVPRIDVDDSGYDIVRPKGENPRGTSMECEVPLGDPSSSRMQKKGAEPMESEDPDYEELFYSAADEVVAPAAEEEEPVYAVPMKKKLRDRLINVIGSVGGSGSGGGGGSSSGGSSGDVSQDRTPLPTPRNGCAIRFVQFHFLQSF